MTQTSLSKRVTRTIAEATGRSEGEVDLALTGAAITAGAAAALVAAVALLKLLADLGTDVIFSHPNR